MLLELAVLDLGIPQQRAEAGAGGQEGLVEQAGRAGAGCQERLVGQYDQGGGELGREVVD